MLCAWRFTVSSGVSLFVALTTVLLDEIITFVVPKNGIAPAELVWVHRAELAGPEIVLLALVHVHELATHGFVPRVFSKCQWRHLLEHTYMAAIRLPMDNMVAHCGSEPLSGRCTLK